MKTSKWTIPQLKEAVETSETFQQLYTKLGYKDRPGHSTRIFVARYIEELGLDTTHIIRWASLKGREQKEYSLDELLIENSTYSGNSGRLKKRLFEAGLLIEKCAICNLEPHWCGKKLTLQLDHINGNNKDNRIENLRILCPNCHTQTETYNKGAVKPKRNEPTCKMCGKTIGYRSQICRGCSGKSRQTRNWPEDSVLFEEVTQHGLDFIAKKYNVIKKALKARLDRRKFDYSTCSF
jgi:RNA polymerase subunit RPABC4/transcription elongation factor Spt4